MPRAAALRPQERFAALLAARDAALACELLALRARADLDHDRPREAALQLEAALAAAASELESWRELRRHGGAARGAARARAGGRRGRRRPPAPAGSTTTPAPRSRHALGRLEAALRARTAGVSF